MFRLRIYDSISGYLILDSYLDRGGFTRNLNATDTFEATITRSQEGVENIAEGDLVELVNDKTVLFSGRIQTIPKNLEGTFKLQGRALLDDLFLQPSLIEAYYEDAPLLAALTELLVSAGWLLGEVGSILDPDATISIDVRGEENLLKQINRILGGLPQVFYRQGAISGGYNTLDIGVFGENGGMSFLQKGEESDVLDADSKQHYIEKLSFRSENVSAIHAIEALGGGITANSGGKSQIDLGDAVSADSTLTDDPDYPILETMGNVSAIQRMIFNLKTYPYPGGRYINIPDGALATNWALGDVSTGNTVLRYGLVTFRVAPGYLQKIVTKFNTTSGLGTEFVLTWELQTLESDGITVESVVTTGTFDITVAMIEDSIYAFDFSELGLLLEHDKTYGFAFGPDVDGAGPSVETLGYPVLAGSATGFCRFQYFNAGFPGIGVAWTGVNDIPYLEVYTTPVNRYTTQAITKSAPNYAPPDVGVDATTTEREKAGLALYEWGKTMLLENQGEQYTYQGSGLGSAIAPKAGEAVRVRSEGEYTSINPVTRTINRERVLIDKDLRVDKYKVTFSNELIRTTYTLREGTGISRGDQFVVLHEITSNTVSRKTVSPQRHRLLLLDEVTLSISDAAPDAEMSDGRTAYQASFWVRLGATYATRPADTENAYPGGLPYGTSPDGELDVEYVSVPNWVAGEEYITVNVAFKTRGWQYGDSAEMTAKVVWR